MWSIESNVKFNVHVHAINVFSDFRFKTPQILAANWLLVSGISAWLSRLLASMIVSGIFRPHENFDFLRHYYWFVNCTPVGSDRCTSQSLLPYFSFGLSFIGDWKMSTVSRSINLLWRSSRASLLHSRAVNPIQRVWSNERLAARTFATHFERTKPHVNIGTASMGSIYSIDLLTVS